MLNIEDVKQLKPTDRIVFSGKVWVVDGWNFEPNSDHFAVRLHDEKDAKVTSSFTNEQLHLVGQGVPALEQPVKVAAQSVAKKPRAKKRA